jgi:hypothetical protein
MFDQLRRSDDDRNVGWDYWLSEPRVPPKRPWLRDSLIAVLYGLLLGGSVATRIGAGYWPVAAVFGVAVLIIHVLILTIGQVWAPGRLRLLDLGRIALVAVVAVLIPLAVAAVAGWL